MNENILKAIYFNKVQSIAQLSKTFNKSIPLITKSINQLVESSILEGSDLAASTGGRRAIQFKLNSKLPVYTLVIALDQYYTSISIYDLQNTIIGENTDIYNPLTSNSQTVENIITATVDLLKKTKISIEDILGIGISMPGFVNPETGVNDSYEKDTNLHQIKQHIATYFRRPTIIENDSTCIAFAEQKFGVGQFYKNSLVINLNWGVGLGMIINYQIFKGSDGYAGEFSHIPLSDSDDLCSCGKKGCLEVEASLTTAIKHIEKAIQAGDKSNLTTNNKIDLIKQGDRLINSAINGDQLAVASLGKIAYMLGKGIATLIHILNPEAIIISGRGSKAGNILLPQIQTALNEYCIPRLAQATTLKLSELNKQAQSLGTAAFVIDNLINTIPNTNYSNDIK